MASDVHFVVSLLYGIPLCIVNEVARHFLKKKKKSLLHTSLFPHQGNGCQFCELRAQPGPANVITLESIMYPTQHVGILASGQPKPPPNTRKGPNGQFTVVTVHVSLPLPGDKELA